MQKWKATYDDQSNKLYKNSRVTLNPWIKDEEVDSYKAIPENTDFRIGNPSTPSSESSPACKDFPPSDMSPVDVRLSDVPPY